MGFRGSFHLILTLGACLLVSTSGQTGSQGDISGSPENIFETDAGRSLSWPLSDPQSKHEQHTQEASLQTTSRGVRRRGQRCGRSSACGPRSKCGSYYVFKNVVYRFRGRIRRGRRRSVAFSCFPRNTNALRILGCKRHRSCSGGQKCHVVRFSSPRGAYSLCIGKKNPKLPSAKCGKHRCGLRTKCGYYYDNKLRMIRARNGARFARSVRSKVYKCFPNHISANNRIHCSSKKKCSSGQKCQIVRFATSPGIHRVCVRTNNPSVRRAKCGRWPCALNRKCGHYYERWVTWTRGRRGRRIRRTRRRTKYVCLPKNIAAITSQHCNSKKKCSPGRKCQIVRFGSSPGIHRVCIRKKRSIAGRAKCGRRPCALNRKCGHYYERKAIWIRARRGRRIRRTRRSKKYICLPENIASITSQHCNSKKKCSPGRKCQIVRFGSSPGIHRVCIRKKRSIVGRAKCGRRPCALNRKCGHYYERRATWIRGRRGRRIRRTRRSKKYICLPKNIASITSQHCNSKKKCSPGRKCQIVRFGSSPGIYRVCIRKKRSTVGRAKCGRRPCALNRKCGHYYERRATWIRGQSGRRTRRIRRSKKYICLPENIASITSQHCNSKKKCSSGRRCQIVRFGSSSGIHRVCVRKKRSIVGRAKCGGRRCGRGRRCVYFLGSPVPLRSGTVGPQSRRRVQICSPRGRKWLRKLSCSAQKPCKGRKTCRLAKLEGIPRRTFKICVTGGRKGSRCGKCPPKHRCRAVVDAKGRQYKCRPSKCKPCYGRVFCRQGTRCSYVWQRGIWAKRCIAHAGCGKGNKICKRGEKCEKGTCVTTKQNCGIDGQCSGGSSCRSTVANGKKTRQCLPSIIRKCPGPGYWCPRGFMCAVNRGGKTDCKRFCGRKFCAKTEKCVQTRQNGLTCAKRSCREVCASRNLQCARVFSVGSGGRVGSVLTCASKKRARCGRGICGTGTTCERKRRKGRGGRLAIVRRCAKKSTAGGGSGPTCPCAKPKCYDKTCAPARCAKQESYACLSDLLPIMASVEWSGNVSPVVCYKKNRKRTFYYRSADKSKQCRPRTIHVAVPKKITPHVTVQSNDNTCVCEQDPKQRPGYCYTWNNPLKSAVDKSCKRKRCDKSWKCSVSQLLINGKLPNGRTPDLCKRRTILQKVTSADAIFGGKCVGVIAPRYVWVRVEQ